MHSTVIIVEIHVGDEQPLFATRRRLDRDIGAIEPPLDRGACRHGILGEGDIGSPPFVDPRPAPGPAARRVQPVGGGGNIARGDRFGCYQRGDEHGELP
ncbi:hypothetical protein [Sphingomonas hankookensis]|uniref:hypothetical protein n=1 Tax=Sphingomonas hankookensis TaxID=563996 RepID=UPI003F7AC72E